MRIQEECGLKAGFRNSSLARFMVWSAIGGRALDSMSASAQVIAHRTNRMLLAGVSPNKDDPQEFALMMQEKVEAGVRSSIAMTMHLIAMGPFFGMRLAAYGLQTSAAMMALARSQTAEQSLA